MKTAKSRFEELDANRRTLLDRYEDYARFTIPSLFRDTEFNQNVDEESLDYQSFGARCVNHLTNKLMLTLLAPSRPFFRIEVEPKMMKKLIEAGFPEEKLTEVFAENERRSVKLLDQRSVRPKIQQAIKQLIVLGNTLMVFEKGKIKVINVRNFVVVRDDDGNVIEIVIRKSLDKSQLQKKIRQRLETLQYTKEKVTHYIWCKVNKNDDFEVRQFVDDIDLGEDFQGKYNEDSMPYRVLTWDLTDGDHYGKGHIEEYINSFAKISNLSRAETQVGVQAAELRWMVNPEGSTSVQDFMNTGNGDVIPGRQGDISAVVPDVANSLQVIQPLIEKEKAEVGQAFLLGSSAVRDAERVTAEEIRLQANELETGLGGAYTRIAVDFQKPLARWLLKELDVKINNEQIEITIITGLDALSRNGDLENNLSWLRDMALLEQLPPNLLNRLKIEALATDIAAARGVTARKYWKTPEELQAEQAQIQAMQAAQAQAGVPGSALPKTPT